ncbi:MAG TPA: hypothetical protein VFG78_08680 [Gemmatimonadota bacterium]|nr:hypothetical protein [Gemmatimonadota bacterium]
MSVRRRTRFGITGDLSHFGPYFGRRLAGVRILTGDYLRTRS